MNNEWDEYADKWDSDPSAVDYAKNAFAELKKLLKLNDLRVLDFGCGTGLLTEMLSPEVDEVVALDGSPKMIECLDQKALPNVHSIVGFLSEPLLEETPLLSKKFDLVVASSVCSFLPDYPATASLLASMMEPNAVFVQWDWLSTTDGFGLSEERVRHTLVRAGLNDIALSQPFTMENSHGAMPVLMATGRK